MKPPNWFLTAIQTLDPLLSVRWGTAVRQWVIERKALIPLSEMAFLRRRLNRLTAKSGGTDPAERQKYEPVRRQVAEELEAASSARRVILFARQLDRRIFEALCLGDITRYGGYSRYAHELEAREAYARRDLERSQREERIALSKEVAGLLDFANRKRSSQLLDSLQRNRQVIRELAREASLPGVN